MRKLIYSMGVSLDGFIAGPDGKVDWSAPDEDLHRLHNEQTRELGAYLCGRRLYETMVYWEAAEANRLATDYELEFAHLEGACRRSCFRGPLSAARVMPGWPGTPLPKRSPSRGNSPLAPLEGEWIARATLLGAPARPES